MSVVTIKYSVPIYNQGEKLDGSLGKTIRGWHHFAITIQTHVASTSIKTAMGKLVPTGYYLTNHPQVSATPPRVDMYQITSTGEKFSSAALPFSITRGTSEDQGAK